MAYAVKCQVNELSVDETQTGNPSEAGIGN